MTVFFLPIYNSVSGRAAVSRAARFIFSARGRRPGPEGAKGMYERKRCVLLADDETRILRALRDLLSANGFFVLTAENGRQALEKFEEYSDSVDLVLLDVMMPELDGFQVLSRLRAVSPHTPVIMLTARGGEYDQLQGFSQGADDYIPKPFSTSLLLARMEAVLRRTGQPRVATLETGGVSITPEQHRVEVDGRAVELTPREFDLLYCFMRNPGLILSRGQLLDQVWGFDYDGDERTVDTHVKNLRLKLGPRAEYVQTVYRVGYKFEVKP